MGKKLHLFRRAFTPVTIMVIPHENLKSSSFRIPKIFILLSIFLFAFASVQVISLAVKGLEQPFLVERLNLFAKKFDEWNGTLADLKKTERDFQKLFALGSKEKVLENVEVSFSGDIDWNYLKLEIEKAVEGMGEIRDYLRVQKDIYMATPKGFPARGSVSSPYGMRENPFGGRRFHAGVDISCNAGTPIKATAEGIVSFSGLSGGSGHVIVLEHGCGFSTVYAHNKKNLVKVGQRIKRGETIALVGSTGNATGPHLHYEVLQNGKHVNPKKFLSGSADVRQRK